MQQEEDGDRGVEGAAQGAIRQSRAGWSGMGRARSGMEHLPETRAI